MEKSVNCIPTHIDIYFLGVDMVEEAMKQFCRDKLLCSYFTEEYCWYAETKPFGTIGTECIQRNENSCKLRKLRLCHGDRRMR